MLKRVMNKLQMAWRPAWQKPEVAAIYHSIVTQARRPEFYQAGGVPDTLDGRFDVLVLHLAFIMNRLKNGDEQAIIMRQYLFDFFAADLDRSLREMGVGDMGISRRIRQMGQACYGRMASYDDTLAQPPDQQRHTLMMALDKNLYGTVPTNQAALGWMADYALTLHQALAQQELAVMLSSVIAWPLPETSLPEALLPAKDNTNS